MQLKILPLFFLSACCAGAQTLPHGAAGLPEDSTRTTTKAPLRERRLGEATVMGMSEARRTKVAPLTVSVLGLQQLEGTASSLNGVLQRVAGVTVRATGGVGSASRISVRGLEGKRMGMFVDEAAMGQMSNFVNIDDIPTDMIERVEIYKGIVPYKLGGSALGGAVNVVTKEYPEHYFDASYEVGSYNTHRFNTIYKHRIPGTHLQWGAGGGWISSDNDYEMTLATLGNRRIRRNNDRFEKLMVGTSLTAKEGWFDELKSELIGFYTRQGVQGFDNDIREAYNHAQSVVWTFNAKRDNFFLQGLDFDWDVAYNLGRYGLKDLAKTRYDWDGNRIPSLSPHGGEANNYPSDGRHVSHDFMSKLNLEYRLNPVHAFNLNLYATNTVLHPKNEPMDKALGFSANFNSRLSSLITGLSYDLTLLDGHLQSAFTLKNFWVNSRAKMLQNFYISQPVPVRIDQNRWGASWAVRYSLDHQWMLKMAASSEVRVPTSEELIGNGYSILPSIDLAPERNKALNFGALFHHNNERGGLLEAEVNLFLSQLDDMIRFMPDMIPTMARYRNFGKVRTMGIEGEVKWDALSWLYLYANATLQDLRDRRRFTPGTTVENPTYDKRIPNVPYTMANFGFELHCNNLFGGRGQRSRFLLDASYIHEYFYDFEMSKYQSRKIPTSLTFDLGVEHSFGHRRWTLSAKLRNLTDRAVMSELNRPLPGRNFAVKLRYLLK